MLGLFKDEDSNVREIASTTLGPAFSYIPDKEQARQNLHRLTLDTDRGVRANAASSLGSAFSHIPDKEQAWQDLHRLIEDEDLWIATIAVRSLQFAFPYVPDKKQVWQYMHSLTLNGDEVIKAPLLKTVTAIFPYIPNKEQASEDLNRLKKGNLMTLRPEAYALPLKSKSITEKSIFSIIKEFIKDLDEIFLKNILAFTIPNIALFLFLLVFIPKQ